MLGTVFATRFSDCALNPSDTQELVKNACRCSDEYALGAGFRCRSSRSAAPNARATLFERDAPRHMSPPDWFLFLAVSELRLSNAQRLQPYRFAVPAPSPQSLRGSLGDEGFVYQFTARASALVMLLASVWLTQ